MVVREKDDEYIYFGRFIIMKNDFLEEGNMRIRFVCRVYGKYLDIGRKVGLCVFE